MPVCVSRMIWPAPPTPPAIASGGLGPPVLGSPQFPKEDYDESGSCPVAGYLDGPLPHSGDTAAILGSDGSTTVGAVVRRRLSAAA